MPLRLVTLDKKIENTAEAREWIEHQIPRGGGHRQECAPFWLDIVEPDPDAIDWLAMHFHFHPLTIEDLRSPNERGKLEQYETYLFLIAHSISAESVGVPPKAQEAGHSGHNPKAAGGGTARPAHNHEHPQRALADNSSPKSGADLICAVEGHELHAYLARNFLITVHDPGMKPVEKVWKSLDNRGEDEDPHPLVHGPDFLLYLVLDGTADSYFNALEITADQIDYLEDRVIDKPDRDLLDDVFTVKRNLVTIRRMTTPMREALNSLSHPGNPFVRDANEVYLRDVHNLLVSVYELADTQRDSTSGVLDAYLSSVNNNLSVVMKRLTAITTIFLPLTVIVGFGGMNFVKFIPYDSPVMFWSLMASLVISPLLIFIWLWRSRML